MLIRWATLFALILFSHISIVAQAQVKSVDAARSALLRVELYDPETGRSTLLGMASHIGNGNVLTSNEVVRGQPLKNLRLTSLNSDNALLVNSVVFEDSHLALLTAENATQLGLNYFALSAQGVAPRTQAEPSDPISVIWTTADRSVQRFSPTILSVDSIAMRFNADLNYSAMGAPLLNQCGHIIGLVDPSEPQPFADAQSFAGQLPPILMSSPHVSIDLDRLKSALTLSNVSFTTGEVDNCVTPHFLEWDSIRKAEQAADDAERDLVAAERQLELVRAETRRQQEIAAAAEQRAIDAKALQDAAELKADEADRKRIDAEAAEAEAREDEQVANEARNRANRSAEVNSGFGRWAIYLSSSVVALIVFAALLVWMRSLRAVKLSAKQTADLQRVLEQTMHGNKIFLTDSTGRRIAVDGVRLADSKLGIVVGRSSKQSDIPIQGEDVSRQHAKFFVTDKGLFVEDLASENGTSLNNTRLTAYQPQIVENDDMIGFADQWFKVVFQKREA